MVPMQTQPAPPQSDPTAVMGRRIVAFLIDYAIAGGMRIVEAGAQGEHKFLRGFVAKPTYSAHWLAHPSGRAAIERYLDGEREQMQNAIEGYNGVSPVKDVRSQGRTD